MRYKLLRRRGDQPATAAERVENSRTVHACVWIKHVAWHATDYSFAILLRTPRNRVRLSSWFFFSSSSYFETRQPSASSRRKFATCYRVTRSWLLFEVSFVTVFARYSPLARRMPLTKTTDHPRRLIWNVNQLFLARALINYRRRHRRAPGATYVTESHASE